MYTWTVAEAKIRIDQAANSIPVGVPSVSRDDILLGQVVSVRNGSTNGVRTRRWVLSPPADSAAVLSSTDGEAPTFTPDVFGTYLIKLSVNTGLDLGVNGDEVDEIAVIVRDPAGHRFPATSEAAQANYQTAPGVFNKEGWKPDLQRMLQSYDNRGQTPIELTVGAGDTEQIAVALPDNMDEGVLQYLRVLSSTSSDTTLRVLADSVECLSWQNFDALTPPGARYMQNVSIINDNDGLPDHEFILELTNNDGAPSDYQIWLRVKAT